MNNEIKEILDFKENADYKKLSCDEILVLRDYITNLQEENKDLREKNKEAHDFDETMKDIKENLIARINRQECEIHNLKTKLEMYENGVYFSSKNDKLQEKIDKAIEHIKHNEIYDIKENEINKTLFDILEGKK